MKTPRQASYESVYSWIKEGRFISESLNAWRAQSRPEERDWHLAQEISYGTIRSWRILEDYHQQFSVKIKNREKALLFIAYYQMHVMVRIPSYALVNETVALAKKLFSLPTSRFFNAHLRKCLDIPITLPLTDDPIDLAKRFSFPNHFVEELCARYDIETVKQILTCSNRTPITMIRQRTPEPPLEGLDRIDDTSYFIIQKGSFVETIAKNPNYYIQNVTPGALLDHLAKKMRKTPLSILDLCASPGGKSILLHDYYPQAELTVNDISEIKLKKLRENFQRCGVEANVTCFHGELFPDDKKFDLILVDAPCSNSGVLARRPEARWRLDTEGNLQEIQKNILQHATTLLNPDGELWYMTCSILSEENERLVQEAGFHAIDPLTILPNEQGFDGGFACRIGKGT